MIGDRHVFVVRAERIVRIAPAAAIGRVMNAGKEIGEAGDCAGRCIAQTSRRARAAGKPRALPAAPAVGGEQVEDLPAQGAARPGAERHQRVERAARRRFGGDRRLAREQPGGERGLADRKSCRRSRCRRAPARRARLPGGLNTPNGRFCSGNSLWPLAESTQLWRFGSWVSSIAFIARLRFRLHQPMPIIPVLRRAGEAQKTGSTAPSEQWPVRPPRRRNRLIPVPLSADFPLLTHDNPGATLDFAMAAFEKLRLRPKAPAPRRWAVGSGRPDRSSDAEQAPGPAPKCPGPNFAAPARRGKDGVVEGP